MALSCASLYRSFSIIMSFLLILLLSKSLMVDSVLSASPVQQPARYSQAYQQQQYGQNYQQEYQQHAEQPQRNARYGNNMNNNYNHNKQPVNRLQHYQQQASPLNHQNSQLSGTSQRSNTTVSDRGTHKCRVWVPSEAFHKYQWPSKIQIDQSNQLQLIEICCPGYGPLRWRGNTLCRPLCDNCQNGHCLSPGVCQCYEEFAKNDNGDCVFTCPLGCLNGRCYLDGSCQCDAGYKLDETRKFCRPICSAGCGLNARHNCTEPEVCGCAKGYQLTDDGCQPTCTPDCGVGGYCREYNMCECGPGYTLKEGVCQSDCYQKCDNGICYGRNRCICNHGYTYHEKSTQCIPA